MEVKKGEKWLVGAEGGNFFAYMIYNISPSGKYVQLQVYDTKGALTSSIGDWIIKENVNFVEKLEEAQ